MWFDMSTFPYNDSSSYDFWKVNKVIHSDGSEEIVDKNAKGIVTLNSDDFITTWILDLWGKEKIDITWRTKEKEVNIPENMTIAWELWSIDDVSEDILDTALICAETQRPYRVIWAELQFLKKKWLPLPHLHHELRIDTLLSERPIWELHMGKCDKCNIEMLSIFKWTIEYKVYCPECYKNYMFK